jgi:Protein of unknown function (DUF2958)
VILLTRELEQVLPPCGSQATEARVKFFTPDAGWTWYASEASAVLYDGTEVGLSEERASQRQDVLFFGLVDGLEEEYGYFLLSEIEAVRGPLGLAIERDLYWTPRPLKECERRYA